MKRGLQFVLGGLAVLVLLELVLRLLPVNHGWANPPVTAQAPVIRQYPGAAYVYSHGWDMRDVESGRFNALGFPSRLVDPAGRPEVDLVGDSFVEASMLPQGGKIEARLNAAQSGYVVNAFGMSGSDLPAYAIYARWAARTRRPATIVVNLVGGDLKGAVTPTLRGWWWAWKGDHLEDRSKLDFRTRNTIASSRLAAYVLFNLRFGKDVVVQAFKSKAPANADVIAGDAGVGAAGKAGPSRPPAPLKPALGAAADRFVAEMAALRGSGVRVILMADADRRAIYRGAPSARADADVVLPRAQAAGLETLDLQPVFAADWAAHHRRFDFGAIDQHWNGYGAEVVAAALAAKLASPPPPPPPPPLSASASGASARPG